MVRMWCHMQCSEYYINSVIPSAWDGASDGDETEAASYWTLDAHPVLAAGAQTTVERTIDVQ